MNNDEQNTQASTPDANENEANDIVQNTTDMSTVDESADNSIAADAGTDNADQADSPADVVAGEARDEQDAQEPREVTTPTEDEAAPQIAEASETSQAEGDTATIDADLAEQADASDEQKDATGEAEPASAPEAAVAEAASPEAEAPQAIEAEAAAAPEEAEAPKAVEAEAASGESESDYEEPVVRSAPRLEDVAPNASMEDLLRASEQQYRTLKHGDVIEGAIMKVGRDELMVDIGAKTEGVVPSSELQSLTQEERDALQIGDTLLVSVVQPENNEGHAVLSLDRARQERSWRDLQKQYESGEVLQAKVTGYNKGGLLVNIEGVRGFIPSSQISLIMGGGNDAAKQSEMAKMQNQMISLKIIEINRARNRLILSERQATQEQRESVRTRLLRELEPGQVRQGRVSSICDFGAFVDIGGADGLIHLSEISWKRVGHPSEVLKVGDMIDVYVLSVDPNERKIALSLKRTQPEPWSTITDNYKLGQIVRGTITQLTTFGAFARLDDGIEGLIHVSELAEGRVAHPKNVVNVGDVLDLKVIRIDPIKRRIGLSLKRVHEDENGGEFGGTEGLAAGAGESAASTAPTAGAYGEEGEPGMSQVQVTEASSLEGEQAASTPAATTERNERFERAERPRAERPERSDRGSRQQNRQTAAATDRQAADDAPMGALAQALGAFMNRDEEEPEETDAAPVAEEKEATRATKKAAPVAEEPTSTPGEEEAPAAEEAAPVIEVEAPAAEEEAPAAEEETPATEEAAAPVAEEEATSSTEDAEATEEKATDETES
jgi:small subunit ribosomal protein S1